VSALSVHGLHHAYGEHRVLDGIDLALGAGELLAVVGPNGVGKSTLLRLCLGFLPIARGEVRLGGRPIGELARREVARLASFVPQGFTTDFAFSVRELVAMGRTPWLGRFQPEGERDRKAIARALAATDLEALAGRPFPELSGGERQRVVLARALAQETPVLVLDEPTASLDLLHAFRLLEIVRARVDEGAAAIAALHDLALAARFCDRMVVLHRGRVHAAGKPADVLTPDVLREVFGVDARVLRDGDDLLVGVRGPA
jgi:iron complex transport system ATP-binding protein